MFPPYEQPDFATLSTKSNHLKKEFYGLAEFFLLFSKKERDKTMDWIELREEVASLPAKYTQAVDDILKSQSYFSWGCRLFGSVVSSVGLSSTDRAGQIQAITDLLPLLKESEPQVLPLSEEKEKEDKLRIYTLLGALFYRFLRIIHDYASLEEAIAQSALCRAIYQMIGLSPKNKLDHWTIMTCCQLFYDFIRKDDTAARIPYIQEDPRFFEKLEAIIAEHKVLAKPVLDQLVYIDFVQSISKTLADFAHKFTPLLDELLTKKLPQSCQSPKAILDYFDTLQDLLPYHRSYLHLVIANDNTEFSVKDARSNVPKSLQEAIEQIKLRIRFRNEYTLLGAYLSVLMRHSLGSWPDKQVQQDKEMLYGLLNTAIVTEETGQLDYEARDVGLEYLCHFISLPEISRTIDLSCWEHVTFLKRELEQERMALTLFLAKERAQRESEVQAVSLSCQ